MLGKLGRFSGLRAGTPSWETGRLRVDRVCRAREIRVTQQADGGVTLRSDLSRLICGKACASRADALTDGTVFAAIVALSASRD